MGIALVQQLCNTAGIDAKQTWVNADVLIKQPVALSGNTAVFDLSDIDESTHIFVWVLHGTYNDKPITYIGSHAISKTYSSSIKSISPVKYSLLNTGNINSVTTESNSNTNISFDQTADTVTISRTGYLTEVTGAILVVISYAA